MLWWFENDPRLDALTIAAVESEDTDVLMSIVSLWEIAVKVRTGKVKVDLREVASEAAEIGFEALAIEPRHLEIPVGLPMHHRDPFDHLLIAQAIGEGARLVTRDRLIRAYPVNVLD